MNTLLRKEYYDKAYMLHENGCIEEAMNYYGKILAENPDDSEVLNLMGVGYYMLSQYDKAEYYTQKAVSLENNRYYYDTLSKIYSKQNRLDEALMVLNAQQEVLGEDFESCFNIAYLYKQMKDYEKAIEYYNKALEFIPNSKKSYFNLANIYLLLNDCENAKKCYEEMLKIDPEDREVKYFLSLCYFRLKDYEHGFPYFEERLCRETAYVTHNHTYPNLVREDNFWKGEDISDKTLYTYFEAGFGDMLMFARYIPILAKRCKKLIIKPQVELSQLFKDNFPQAEIMDYFRPESDMQFDVHIPFLSVPYVLGLKNDEIFVSKHKYLDANIQKVSDYRYLYFYNKNLKIAIKWQGNTYYETDRVINVDAFDDLFKLENTSIYSAQTFEGSEEFEKLSQKYKITDLSKSFKDFSYTAAALKNVDLVICNDTSLAHLAGAMHVPCVVLLPYNTNWRWHTDFTKCDWYDSVKLYRADKDESWNSLVHRVVEDLKNGKIIDL